MKKGIALTTETIIIIILAVIVLAALLLFFTGVWGSGTGHIDDVTEKTKLCGEYVERCPTCDCDDPEFNTVLTKLYTACGDICQSGVADPDPSSECAKKCCTTLCRAG